MATASTNAIRPGYDFVFMIDGDLTVEGGRLLGHSLGNLHACPTIRCHPAQADCQQYQNIEGENENLGLVYAHALLKVELFVHVQ